MALIARKDKNATKLSLVLAALLVCSLVTFSAPRMALAETAAELQARLTVAQKTLDDLGNKVMTAGEALYETEYAITETQGKIAATQSEVGNKEELLAETKQALAKRVKSAYKAGHFAPLSLLLDDEGLDKLISYPYYANKVAAQDVQTINQVRDAKTALEEQARQLAMLQLEQEQLAEQQKSQLAVLETARNAQQTYVDSLDQAVREKLADETARALLEQQAVAGNAQAKLELEYAREADAKAQEALANITFEVPEGSPTNIADITGSARSTMDNETRLTILGAAFSQIGVPYALGSEDPSVGLDCSGFTQYCYRQAGIELPHSAAAQSAMARASSIENLQPGDLIFWIGTGDPTITGNHVAMYIGDGQIIHAVWNGVKISNLYSGYTKFGVII
ncbi:MAG: NlpC/P60 family protein [Coriobacteriales bacterium]|nr:NlpC/P60 family protein [Coriobacteriales bacterium]